MLIVWALPVLCFLLISYPGPSWGLASNNIPLDSPIYDYIEKLSGFGLIDTEINGLKPYSRAEAARLVLEAEEKLKGCPEPPELVVQIIQRMHELVPRELDLYRQEAEAPLFDWDPVSSLRARYVYLDGEPRSYDRLVSNPGGQGIFGIGHLAPKRPDGHTEQGHGTEGTPLFENNEGIRYKDHDNLELRTDTEFYFTRHMSALVEPLVLGAGIGSAGAGYRFRLNKGYIKLGGKGLELEAGRDSNWFGQGYRGTTVLTDNSPNLDLIKLSSTEPVGWRWLRRNVGLVKYALFLSRLQPSGSGSDMRRPWFVGLKLALKATRNLEIGINVARQFGGPNVKLGGGIAGMLFGGQSGDGSNFVGGIDFRYRMRFLRDSVFYFEYAGEDSALFWPFMESYVVGFYAPRLTADGKNDLRFEFYYGNQVAYTDNQFPEGFTDGGYVIGHSQGGDTKEYFTRFTHYFSVRNRLALEYFHTQRGRLGKVGREAVEEKDAGRIFWHLPVYGNWDAVLGYGHESVRNFDLVRGARRVNSILRVEFSYRY